MHGVRDASGGVRARGTWLYPQISPLALPKLQQQWCVGATLNLFGSSRRARSQFRGRVCVCGGRGGLSVRDGTPVRPEPPQTTRHPIFISSSLESLNTFAVWGTTRPPPRACCGRRDQTEPNGDENILSPPRCPSDRLTRAAAPPPRTEDPDEEIVPKSRHERRQPPAVRRRRAATGRHQEQLLPRRTAACPPPP